MSQFRLGHCAGSAQFIEAVSFSIAAALASLLARGTELASPDFCLLTSVF
jgi:hypothetical protein